MDTDIKIYSGVLAVMAGLLAVFLLIVLRRSRNHVRRLKQTEAERQSREQEYRQLLISAERQAQELRLLDQARTAMARELDLSVLIRTVVEAIADTFGYTQVSLYLIQNNVLVLQHKVGYETFITHIPIDRGVSGRTVRSGKPILLEDVRTDPDFLGAMEGLVSEICIPLFDRHRVVGILNIESTGGVRLTGQDLALMTAFSDHINMAITRAQLYAEVRESENRYRSVVDSISEVIFQTDTEGRLTFLNPAWTRLTGYTVQESLQTNLMLYVHPEDRKSHTEWLKPLMQGTKETIRYEFRYMPRDGNFRWVDVHARPLIDQNGRITGVFGTIDDITEKKKTDEDRLRLSKLEAITPLAGGIAHDFNNLLTGILGHISFAQLLITPVADERLKPRLEMAERATLEAQKLTQQLLTFARGGKPVKQLSPIREIIYEAAMFVSRGSNVRCDFSIPENLWPGEVDSGQIGQVIQNLILNAQQAMPDGGVIHLSAENFSITARDPNLDLSPGSYVVIRVKDSGNGIAPEVLPRIFDPYFTTKPDGTGLGLATAHSIVVNHHGVITIDSTVNKGATFSVYLPANPQNVIVNSTKEAVYYHNTGKILVMEDEPIVRNLLIDILTHCGYEATVTADGTAAVDAYIREYRSGIPFDAVIMDLTVPGGMGGKEAVKQILETDPKAKVIVSSGYSNDPVLADYKAYGFVGIVPKPYKTTQLSEVLLEVLTESTASGF